MGSPHADVPEYTVLDSANVMAISDGWIPTCKLISDWLGHRIRYVQLYAGGATSTFSLSENVSGFNFVIVVGKPESGGQRTTCVIPSVQYGQEVNLSIDQSSSVYTRGTVSVSGTSGTVKTYSKASWGNMAVSYVFGVNAFTV